MIFEYLSLPNQTSMKKTLLSFLLLISIASFAQNLTHSVSQEITSGSVKCTNEFGGGDNTYLRFFKLADFNITSHYSINSIDFGVWGVGGASTFTVKLYATNENFPQNFPGENYTLLAEEEYEVSDLQMMIFSAPITAVVPYGQDLVVQVSYQSAADTFIDLGSNGFGQTSPTYLMADLCEYFTPVDANTTGIPEPFNNLSLVLNVVGGILSVNDNYIAGVKIYPNPANDIINLQLPDGLNIVNVMVTDVTGKSMSVQCTGGVLDFRGYTSGLYCLSVETDKGSFTQKIIKI
jgi:hypothetical protein